MYEIGHAHLKGEGAPRNEQTAVGWFKRSAAMGVAAAQRTLGVMYARELGVDRNRVAAYMLLTLAIENDIPDEKAPSAREEVAKWMTSAEIGKARQLVAAWKPGQDLNLPAAPARADVSVSMIRNLQTLLTELGYDAGAADGVMGQKTKTAIRAFQADRGMPVTGAVTATLEQALKMALKEKNQHAVAVRAGPDNPRLKFVASGSGFAITSEGHILTNDHVIDGCVEIWITAEGRADVLASDETDDLALLRVNSRFEKPAAFRENGPAPLGADIVVAGYPLQSILSTDLGVTTGVVSALSGFRDDSRHLQLSAPIQPGNSGGPVLDRSGNLVGIVVAGLDAVGVAKLTGDVPQNINFAIKSSTALEYLDSLAAPYSVATSTKNRSVADVAAIARKFTVRIECWK
jgi:S1-C subfamily serine protease